MWVRGRAAIALGYENACLDAADVLAEQAIALSDRPSLGRLNAVMGKLTSRRSAVTPGAANGAAGGWAEIFDVVGVR
jgi:hypothetical protein